MRELRLPHTDAEEQYRRMVFNIAARNQDDHTKNIAFLMDPEGQWRLSPAYDVTYAYNPGGEWTSRHQMTVAGKREGFTREDLLQVGSEMSINKPGDIIDEVWGAVKQWLDIADTAGVPAEKAEGIGATHRAF
jgi:serine/threonine-protein kinase HipA